MKIKKFLPVLEYVNGLSKEKQKNFLEESHSDILKAISEICYNVNHSHIDLSPEQVKKLRPYRKEIEFLCHKRPSHKARRRKIQTGGFLGTLLSVVLPALVSTLFSAFGK